MTKFQKFMIAQSQFFITLLLYIVARMVFELAEIEFNFWVGILLAFWIYQCLAWLRFEAVNSCQCHQS